MLAKYKELYLQNEDMVGWISIAGTTVNYPVMQTPNDPSPIGRGTALTGVWNGVPASYRGVPTSAAIWTAALCRNLQAA